MDDAILSLWNSHNEAALRGVRSAAEKIASEYGDEGLEVFEQWLDSVPAEAIFDMENDPQKTASDLDEAGYFDKVAEAAELGRIMWHAFQEEAARHEKMAEYVENGVLEAFLADVQESE